MRVLTVAVRGWMAAMIAVVAHGTAWAELHPVSSGLLLGQGFDAAGGVLRTVCAEGTLAYEGAPQSTVRDDRPASEAELRAMLGLTLPDGGAAPVVPSAQVLSFLESATPQEGAVAVTFAYDVRGTRALLRSPRLSASGLRAAGLSEAERLRMCGDEAVTAIELGGSVLVTLRFDFATDVVKRLFSKDFDFDHVSSANLRGKLQRIGGEYQGKVSITLGALQVGGDVRKLAAIFGDSSGGISLLRCQVDEVAQCAQAMDQAHDYLFGPSGFREQLGDMLLDATSTAGPAMLRFETQPYASLPLAALVVPNPSAEAARAARTRLAAHHARIWGDVRRLEQVLGRSLAAAQQASASEALATARQDAALLRFELEACGTHPEACAALEAEGERALRPYSTRAADAPEWFLPLCREAALGTEARDSVQPILDVFGETDCAKAAGQLEASRALLLRGAGLRDSRVLAWLGNLSSLDLRDNLLVDAAPLATLPKLRRLNLAYNALTKVSPLLEAPSLESAHLQGNPAADASALRARLSADSVLTESDVCEAARRRLLASGAVTAEAYARYAAADLAPIFSAQRTVLRWAPCSEAAHSLDP